MLRPAAGVGSQPVATVLLIFSCKSYLTTPNSLLINFSYFGFIAYLADLFSRRYCVPAQTSSPPPGVPRCISRSAGSRSGPCRSRRSCSPSRHRPPPGGTPASDGHRPPTCFCRSLDFYELDFLCSIKNQTAVAYESLKLQRNLYFTLMTSETLPSSLIES